MERSCRIARRGGIAPRRNLSRPGAAGSAACSRTSTRPRSRIRDHRRGRRRLATRLRCSKPGCSHHDPRRPARSRSRERLGASSRGSRPRSSGLREARSVHHGRRRRATHSPQRAPRAGRRGFGSWMRGRMRCAWIAWDGGRSGRGRNCSIGPRPSPTQPFGRETGDSVAGDDQVAPRGRIAAMLELTPMATRSRP